MEVAVVFRLGFAGGSAQPDPLVGIETPGMGEGEWITRQRLELGARRTKEIGAQGLRIVIRLDRTERVGNGAEKRPWTGCQDICTESMAPATARRSVFQGLALITLIIIMIVVTIC